MSFEEAVTNALGKNAVLKNAIPTDFPEKVGDTSQKVGDAPEKVSDFSKKVSDVRSAAKAVNEAAHEIPAVLAKSYVALRDANDKVLAALGPVRETYSEPEQKLIKESLGEFEVAAEDFQKLSDVARGMPKTEPLMSPKAKQVVGIAAFLMVVLGAVCAAWGAEKTSTTSPLTTLSYWFGFLAVALAGTWLLASFTANRPLLASLGSTTPAAELQYIVFGGMAFVVLGLLVAGVLTGDLLRFLQSIPGARGLITFLIAIGTIAIAVILTLASVLMDPDSNPDALKTRLAAGKEVLTVLVGVLGTIVGFYFANSSGAADKMTVAIQSKTKTAELGSEISVVAKAMGGNLPYDSTPIIFVGNGYEGEGGVTEDGTISVKFNATPNATTGPIPFVVGVRDKGGASATVASEFTVSSKNKVGAPTKADIKK